MGCALHPVEGHTSLFKVREHLFPYFRAALQLNWDRKVRGLGSKGGISQILSTGIAVSVGHVLHLLKAFSR